MIYYRDSHLPRRLGTCEHTTSSTAHMQAASLKAKSKLDENVVNITAPHRQRKALAQRCSERSVFWRSNSFNLSSNSLSLLLRHEVPWCSDALVVLLKGTKSSTARDPSRWLWFVNQLWQHVRISSHWYIIEGSLTEASLYFAACGVEEDMPWFTLILSRVPFFSFLWFQFPLQTVWSLRR